MIRQLGIAVSFLMLASCAEQADEENDGAEQLTEIPPLTYTWSHPDCPFTVDFPGEPEVEIGRTDQGVVSIHVLYETEKVSYGFICDANILDVFPNRENYTVMELSELYADQINSEPDIELIEKDSVKSTIYTSVSGAQLYYIIRPTNDARKDYLNSIVLNVGNTMANIGVAYKGAKHNMLAGEPYLKSLKVVE